MVGLGRSGGALARYLDRQGVRVRIVDADPNRVPESDLPEGAEVRLGGYGSDDLEGCQGLFLSPGVPWNCDLAEQARARDIPVSSETDLFLKLCPAPVVGVTGTNGKTTTTAMIGAVLGAGPRPVVVGGNIGVPMLDGLDELTPEHWVVLELSSFQLESAERPRPRIAVVLNVTPDHLDRHGDMAGYVAAKSRIVRFQEPGDDAVLNGLDPTCRTLAQQTRARVTWFDRHRPLPPCGLPGRHNLQNALAAAAVGRLAGIGDDAAAAALAAFPGVEHRLEMVGDWGGVRWYNDSKATNSAASLMALEAFDAEPVVLIAGGRDGGFDLDPWISAVRLRTVAVVLMGESSRRVGERLEDHPHVLVEGLDAAVAAAADLVRPGGVVLFSPAFKSFDMFRDFEDRGRQFKAAVRAALAAPAG